MKLNELAAFTLDLLDHLDYIGWGDAYEREGSEFLRNEAEQLRPLIEKEVHD